MTWRPFHVLDLDSLDLVRPRSVGVEHAALSVMRPCTFEDKLTELGLNRVQIAAVVGNIVGRRAQPGSELVTQAWLQQRSALGELIGCGCDYEAMDQNRLYRASDALYKHLEVLQDYLFAQAQSIFGFGEAVHPVRPDQHLRRGHSRGRARLASVAMAHQERFARAAQHHPVEIAKDATGLLASAITHRRRLVLVADVGHRHLDSVHAGPCRQARVRAAMLCASTWK